ncbi:MAG: RraA family protein [Treponema sp.]|nr:RraA family protein [Treponema sp.]
MAIKEKTMEIIKTSRCADLSDALDSMGLQDQYSMDPYMRPMIDLTSFCGIARTLEFVKTDIKMPYMEYEVFERMQYARKKDGGFKYMDNNLDPTVQDQAEKVMNAGKGEVIVCAAHGMIGGIFGSDNAHGLINRGVEGIVLDGYMRDTPESILEKVPVFSKGISYVHPMGRIQVRAADKPVVCAGVLVMPGDLIFADHDGIVVIPIRYADEVAYRSYKIQQIDRVNRRRKYQDAGKPMDETVELLPDLARWF